MEKFFLFIDYLIDFMIILLLVVMTIQLNRIEFTVSTFMEAVSIEPVCNPPKKSKDFI